MKYLLKLFSSSSVSELPSNPILSKSWIAGFEAGKRMEDLDVAPIMSPERRQAWLDGHAVGVSYWKRFNINIRNLI